MRVDDKTFRTKHSNQTSSNDYPGALYILKGEEIVLELRVVVTATGKIQDLSSTDSLEGTVMVWLAYVFVSVLISGALLSACHTLLGHRYLPAVRLSQVRPKYVEREVERLWELHRHTVTEEGPRDENLTPGQKDETLKRPLSSSVSLYARRVALGAGFTIVLIA